MCHQGKCQPCFPARLLHTAANCGLWTFGETLRAIIGEGAPHSLGVGWGKGDMHVSPSFELMPARDGSWGEYKKKVQ